MFDLNDHEPLDQLTSNSDWETRKNHGNVLDLKNQVEWVDFKRENYISRRSWVSKLVYINVPRVRGRGEILVTIKEKKLPT